MEKPVLEPLPTWFQRAWMQLRSAIFIGTVAAGFVMGALKAWNEAFPPKEPATTAELHEANEAMQQQFRSIADEVVRGALSTYTDSLATVRRQIEDSVARPVYKAILDLDRRTSRIERRLVEAGMAIEQQQRSSAATAAQMMERLNDNTGDAAVLEALDRVMDRMDDLERQMSKGKTTKQRF